MHRCKDQQFVSVSLAPTPATSMAREDIGDGARRPSIPFGGGSHEGDGSAPSGVDTRHARCPSRAWSITKIGYGRTGSMKGSTRPIDSRQSRSASSSRPVASAASARAEERAALLPLIAPVPWVRSALTVCGRTPNSNHRADCRGSRREGVATSGEQTAAAASASRRAAYSPSPPASTRRFSPGSLT